MTPWSWIFSSAVLLHKWPKTFTDVWEGSSNFQLPSWYRIPRSVWTKGNVGLSTHISILLPSSASSNTSAGWSFFQNCQISVWASSGEHICFEYDFWSMGPVDLRSHKEKPLLTLFVECSCSIFFQSEPRSIRFFLVEPNCWCFQSNRYILSWLVKLQWWAFGYQGKNSSCWSKCVLPRWISYSAPASLMIPASTYLVPRQEILHLGKAMINHTLVLAFCSSKVSRGWWRIFGLYSIQRGLPVRWLFQRSSLIYHLENKGICACIQ